MSTALEKLKKKRGIADAKITRAEDTIKTTDASTLTAADSYVLESLSKRLDTAWEEYSAVQDDILQVSGVDENAENQEYAAKEIRYDHLTALVRGLLVGLSGTPTASASVPTSAPSYSARQGYLKLPKLDLPTFSGSYTEWTSFYDLFSASVDKNSSLSDSQKLHYLKSSVKGDAAKILTSLQITDANYSAAKDILVKRYSNKRIIVREHVHAISTFPAIKQESASALRKLLETIDEHLLALASHQIPVDEWDAILVYIVAEKYSDMKGS